MRKRKGLSAFAVCLAMLILALPSVAAAQNVAVADDFLTIDIPDNLCVFTRDFSRDNPDIYQLGITAQYIEEQFQDGIELLAFQADMQYVIFVKYYPSETLDDFSDYTDEELYDLGSFWVRDGTTDEFLGVYSHKQTRFVNSIYYSANRTMEYCTVVSGMCVELSLLSYTGKFTDAMRTALRAVVDGTVFTNLPELDQAAADVAETQQQTTVLGMDSISDLWRRLAVDAAFVAGLFLVPILAYRIGKKGFVSGKKAWLITCMYAIIIVVAMTLVAIVTNLGLFGVSAFFFLFICKAILTSKRPADMSSNTVQAEGRIISEAPEFAKGTSLQQHKTEKEEAEPINNWQRKLRGLSDAVPQDTSNGTQTVAVPANAHTAEERTYAHPLNYSIQPAIMPALTTEQRPHAKEYVAGQPAYDVDLLENCAAETSKIQFEPENKQGMDQDLDADLAAVQKSDIARTEVQEYRYCDLCGTKFPFQGLFCPNCGKKVK